MARPPIGQYDSIAHSRVSGPEILDLCPARCQSGVPYTTLAMRRRRCAVKKIKVRKAGSVRLTTVAQPFYGGINKC
jgi:hypothetical protein